MGRFVAVLVGCFVAFAFSVVIAVLGPDLRVRLGEMGVGTLAQWAGVCATFAAVLVALFKDEFFRWTRQPELEISIALRPPDCTATPYYYGTLHKGGIAGKSYYFRLWIENKGKTTAQQVQVFAASLARRAADGTFLPVQSFLPMNLRWSHGNEDEPEIFAPGISQEMGKHCDLGRIVDPNDAAMIGDDIAGQKGKAVFALRTEVTPATKSHLIAPGTYRLIVRVGAANCRPVSKTLEIHLTGDWFPNDQVKMLTDGIRINVM